MDYFRASRVNFAQFLTINIFLLKVIYKKVVHLSSKQTTKI